jgi:hypothetical protein
MAFIACCLVFSPIPRSSALDNYNPIGLALLNWRVRDNGRFYCFASATSLVYFENWPKPEHESAWNIDASKAGLVTQRLYSMTTAWKVVSAEMINIYGKCRG